MKFTTCVVAVFLAVISASMASEGNTKRSNNHHLAGALVNPVQKVVSLLTSLEAKIKEDAAKEQKAFEEYSTWCHDGSRDKEFEIKTMKMEMEDLTATISQATAQIDASSTQIEELSASMTKEEAELKAATEVREKESADFSAAEAELMDVVDTLDRAINVLERKLRGSAFAQAKVDTTDLSKMVEVLERVIDAASLSLHDKQKLLALTQNSAGAGSMDSEDDGMDELGAPAAAVYKSHSEGIIDVLEDMREKAQSELAELRKEEATARHNYDLTKQSLEDSLADEGKEMDQAKMTKSSSTETKATAEGDLAVTTKALKDAEETLESLMQGCATAESDHETSMKSRAEELKALAAALTALQEMSSGAEATAYENATSLLQVDYPVPASDKVLKMLKKLAKQTKSSALMQLAGRVANVMKFGVAAGQDPFAKVKAMIKDMLEKLIADAGAEAQHKEYCDKEMAGTKEKLDELNHDQDSLTAKIDKAKAASVTLKDEVSELLRQIAELTKSQAELDEARKAEHSSFVQTKADLDSGLEGVRTALKVLRDYYASSEGAALIQQPEMPEYHDKAEGAGSSIIGMLEVIESDFGKSLAEATMAEDTAATEYEKVSQENRVSKAMKESDVKYKTKEANSLDKSVTDMSSDLTSVQSELEAIMEYKSSIIAQCVMKPESYEERTARREAEIAGLKAALEALQGEAVLLQGKKSGLRGAPITLHY